MTLNGSVALRTDWDEVFVCTWELWFHHYTEEQREAWREWARRHTIDPNTIVVPGWVASFRADRQIHYASDRILGLPAVVVVQLEAEPSRMPR